MLVLTLDAAGDGCSAGLVRDGVMVAERSAAGRSVAMLPGLVQAVLAGAAPDRVVVTVGPGSFTGVRAALALAKGLGLGFGVPVHGVTAGAALRAATPSARPVWVVIDSRPGAGCSWMMAPVSAPWRSMRCRCPAGPWRWPATRLRRRARRLRPGAAMSRCSQPGAPTPAGIAAAPRGAPLPLYVDAPEARPNAAPRPAPAG